MVKVTFADVVKKIGKNDMDDQFRVIFQLHSAIYTVAPDNAAALEALFLSEKESCELVITGDAMTSLILEAKVAEG